MLLLLDYGMQWFLPKLKYQEYSSVSVTFFSIRDFYNPAPLPPPPAPPFSPTDPTSPSPIKPHPERIARKCQSHLL